MFNWHEEKPQEVVVETQHNVIFLTTWLETKVQKGSHKYWDKFNRCQAWEHQFFVGQQASQNILFGWK
jgi:hypothetical protein